MTIKKRSSIESKIISKVIETELLAYEAGIVVNYAVLSALATEGNESARRLLMWRSQKCFRLATIDIAEDVLLSERPKCLSEISPK